ncbi:hypothetical protein I6H07_06130 [Hafnia alvei]|nr:hypothetical protein [Hafnia alvei]MBI0275412.1 hypothetical protein [Hafnia alvei]
MYVNAPRPSGDYAAVRCRQSRNPGFDSQKYKDNPEGGLVFVTEGIRILTFDILFVREGNELVMFDNSFYRPDVKQVMRKHGFAALSKYPTNLRNINLETNWEVRTGITCEFNVLRYSECIIDEMSGAKINGDFVADNKNIIIKGI